MAGQPDPYDAIMFVTYRLRPDADAAVYEDWLRRVDNPFFNGSPLAERYVNWKIAGGAATFAPNTYFDLWDMSNASRFGPLRSDPDLNAFRAEWHRLWGPRGTDHGGQMQGWLCERVAAAAQARSRHLVLRLAADATPVAGWQSWKISNVFFGPRPASGFLQTRFAADARAAAALADRYPDAVLSEIVAAPAH